MSRQFTRDFLLEVARGNVAGMSKVNKFGRNQDVDIASAEDIWSGGGTWVAPTTARLHDITSTDGNDTSAGTGAQTVRVYGLTAWGSAETSEDVTMNGVANVATSSSYVIIHRMVVLTWGTAGPNVGKITATAQTDATVTAEIPATFGQTEMAIYGVPSTQTAHVYQTYCDVYKSTTAVVDNKLLVNPYCDTQLAGFITKDTWAARSDAGHQPNVYPVPRTFAGPCIIKIQSDSSVNNTDIGAGFDLVLVDN